MAIVEYPVYSDSVIAVSLFADDAQRAGGKLLELAIRWLPPQPYRGKNGDLVQTTNMMGGETGGSEYRPVSEQQLAERWSNRALQGCRDFMKKGSGSW